MTEAERIAHRERVKAMQRQREDDLAQRQQLAAADALKRWTEATPCIQHDYLTRKGIQPHGAKIEGDKLLIEPGSLPVRVREVQVHGRAAPRGASGQRLALALHGVKRDDMERGQQVVAPRAAAARAPRP